MRILAATPYYEPEGGGLERYAAETLSRIVRRGHDVEVVTTTRGPSRDGTTRGVHVRRRHVSLALGNAPLDPTFRHRVARAIRDFRPDVVAAHSPVPPAAELAFLAARRAGVPFVVTYHAGRLTGSSFLLDRLAAIDRHTLERRMLKGSTHLVAVSDYVRRNALAQAGRPVAVVPPGVDTARYRPGESAAEPGEILFVGPLSRNYRWKGLDTLWDAYLTVRKANRNATLTLVGDGDRRAEFARRARIADVPVNLAGRLSEDALVSAYRRASLLVLPSLSDAEAFGMVLAEANACARPVVGSRVGGIPDFLRDGDNGLLVAPGDPDELAAAILAILDDPAWGRRMGARGRARVVAEHDWEDIAGRTEAVLEASSQTR